MSEKTYIRVEDIKKISPKSAEQYRTGNFNYPNSKVPTMEKDASYFKMWAEKIYHLCLNGKAWMPMSDYGSIDVMRAYADGRQPTSQYKDWILGSWGIRNDNSQTSSVNGEGWDIRETAIGLARGGRGNRLCKWRMPPAGTIPDPPAGRIRKPGVSSTMIGPQ